jgi:1-acyl-sn-glycerol-3-phosphate acyltransferase
MLFYPITWLARRVERGGERIPREGGALLVLNHVSHLDPLMDAVFVHRNRRVPRFLAKESVASMPFVGRIFRGSGGIPVYRGSASAGDSLKAAREALAEGKVVVIYPEGTITKDPQGWPMRGFTGAARLALDTDVPVIPIARWGTNHIFNGYTKKLSVFPRKTVTHLVGEPIDLTPYRGESTRSASLLREVSGVFMAEITTLLAEIRGEQPPESASSEDPPEESGK